MNGRNVCLAAQNGAFATEKRYCYSLLFVNENFLIAISLPRDKCKFLLHYNNVLYLTPSIILSINSL